MKVYSPFSIVLGIVTEENIKTEREKKLFSTYDCYDMIWSALSHFYFYGHCWNMKYTLPRHVTEDFCEHVCL